jgi:hypothetical protein
VSFEGSRRTSLSNDSRHIGKAVSIIEARRSSSSQDEYNNHSLASVDEGKIASIASQDELQSKEERIDRLLADLAVARVKAGESRGTRESLGVYLYVLIYICIICMYIYICTYMLYIYLYIYLLR